MYFQYQLNICARIGRTAARAASPLLACLALAACGGATEEADESVGSTVEELNISPTAALRGMEYFNILAFGTVNGVASTEGTIAAQGNVALRAAGINKLGPHPEGVVAGGAFSGTGGTSVGGSIKQGNVWLPVNFPNFRIVADSIITELAPVALGSVTVGTTIVLSGSSPLLNVFELTSAQLLDPLDTLKIQLSVPAGSTTVIRVLGTNVVAKTFDMIGADPAKLLWLMPNATQVQISQIDFQGSLLAPKAAVQFYDGDFRGALVAASVTSNAPASGSSVTPTGAYHHAPFTGNLGLSNSISGLPVRLRHVTSGQCLYPEGGNGGLMRHWACWSDPAMSYFIDSAGGGSYRLRNQQSSQCTYSSPTDGGTANHWGCWDDPNMAYYLDPVGTNRYRIRHASTGKCLYTNGGNGGTTNVWSCWNDPNMVFALDPNY